MNASRRFVLVTVISVSGLLTSGIGYFAYLKATVNFHAVEAGRIYRSAQISESDLNRMIVQYGIRSVLNLRGAYPGEAWYDNEIAVSRTNGIEHFDYALSPDKFVNVKQSEELLKVIRNAPTPLLIHCKMGSDRTGLVSALYLFSRTKNRDTAGKELSLRYGHFPYLMSRSNAMDESFYTYVTYALNYERKQ
jgi:protein tyrosine/serine phosphatase